MGLSNYSPNSRISQAGVVPNTAARPAAPYEGQVIYQQDTNQLLVWDGAAWVIPNQTTTNPTGLELIESQSFTSQTQVDFIQKFSSTYDWYRFTIQLPTASGTLRCRLLNGATPTVRDSASYFSAGFALQYDTAIGTSNDSAQTSYGISNVNLGNGAMFTMDLKYDSAGLSMWSSWGHTVSNATSIHKSGGYHGTIAHDGMRFFSTANMSGVIRLYGYRK